MRIRAVDNPITYVQVLNKNVLPWTEQCVRYNKLLTTEKFIFSPVAVYFSITYIVCGNVSAIIIIIIIETYIQRQIS